MRLPQRAENPGAWFALWISAGTFVIWGLLFLLTAAFDQSPGSIGHALSISLGTVDPFDAESNAGVSFAVALAITSWLLVPVLVGTVVALFIDYQLVRSRPLTKSDVDERFRILRNQLGMVPPGSVPPGSVPPGSVPPVPGSPGPGI